MTELECGDVSLEEIKSSIKSRINFSNKLHKKYKNSSIKNIVYDKNNELIYMLQSSSFGLSGLDEEIQNNFYLYEIYGVKKYDLTFNNAFSSLILKLTLEDLSPYEIEDTNDFICNFLFQSESMGIRSELTSIFTKEIQSEIDSEIINRLIEVSKLIN